MPRPLRHLVIATLILLAANYSRADVKLPAIFGDHMVLQRDLAIPVWGWADPGESVTVTATTATASSTASADGRWSVKLTGLSASSTPIEITIAGKNTITIHDVLIGDVWVCSGQSNMEFGIKAFMPKEELEKANEPQIRLFSVPKLVAPSPMKDIGPAPAICPALGSWQVCTPENLVKSGEWSGFPAVGFYFGREIQQFTKQPVGLIGSCWGGTRINSWMSLESLQSVPSMQSYAKGAADFHNNYEELKKTYETVTLPQWKATLEKWKEDNKAALENFEKESSEWKQKAQEAAANKQPAPPRPVAPKPPKEPVNPMTNNQTSSALYNGMIAPIIPFGIKGVLWYQGESNGDQPDFYRIALPTLIKDWRTQWAQGDFSFLVVQLPNFMPRKPEPSESNWAGVREAQALAAQRVPNTGVAVTIDIGDTGNIHPSDKVDVGHRLALVAQYVTYGQKDLVYAGPTYRKFTVEGTKIRIEYDNVSSGLIISGPPETFYKSQRVRPEAPDLSKLQGFAIAGDDRKFVWANATIDGNTVVVWSEAVSNPKFIRYAWADNPACNLYNKEGLPAAPFRTDEPAQ